MKKYTLRWVKNINEFEVRTESQTNEILKDLDIAKEKAETRDMGSGITKYTACAGIPLALAGIAQLVAGSVVGNDGVTSAGVGGILIGTFTLVTGFVSSCVDGMYNNNVKNLANQKRKLIKEIAELRANQVEEVEDEIQ